MNSLVARASLFDDFFRDAAPAFYVRPLHGDGQSAASQIKVEVREGESGFTVHAEVPGVAKEDIQVSIDGNIVSLRAEIRQPDGKRDGDKVLRSERYYGAMARSLQLPAEVDHAQAKAKYENGVLTLTLPRKQTSSAQRLEIQ